MPRISNLLTLAQKRLQPSRFHLSCNTKNWTEITNITNNRKIKSNVMVVVFDGWQHTNCFEIMCKDVSKILKKFTSFDAWRMRCQSKLNVCAARLWSAGGVSSAWGDWREESGRITTRGCCLSCKSLHPSTKGCKVHCQATAY